jgi:hypothetical protein
MNLNSKSRRLVVATVLAAVVLASLAPAAEAGRGWGGSSKHRRSAPGPGFGTHEARHTPRVLEVRRSSSALPLIAGLIGGFALGATLHDSHACPPPIAHAYAPEPATYYYDPYCDERFSSLDIYLSHLRHGGHHPALVRVIDAETGDCVQVLRRCDGCWRDADDDWEDEG